MIKNNKQIGFLNKVIHETIADSADHFYEKNYTRNNRRFRRLVSYLDTKLIN